MRKASGQQRWLIGLLLVTVVFVTRPSIHGNDGVQNYAYLRSILFDGDLDFTNEYAHYFSRAASWFDEKQIPRDECTGRPINLYGVGSAIVWAPWVLLFHAVGLLAHKAGLAISLDGYSPLYEYAVGYGSAFYASVGVFLLYLLLQRYFASLVSFWALLITWLATPLFFYGYLHPSMSHANSFFLSSALMTTYFSRLGKKVKWVTLGLVGGMLALTRFQDGILLLGIVAGEATLALRLWQRKRRWRLAVAWLWRRIPCYFAFWATAVGIFSIQFLVWWKLHGSPLSGPRGYLTQGHLSLVFPKHFWSALFSPFHGLFHWHPVLLLSIWGFFLRGAPSRLKAFAIAGALAQAWVIGSWSIWWAGASFGQRMFISVLPHLAVGMAGSVAYLDRFRRRMLILLLVTIAIFWNFGLVVQYATRMIPRQAPVPITTLATNNLIRVPFEFLKALKSAGETSGTILLAPMQDPK
ncbi:MAG: hypothetical protein N2Z21_04190 [Candidatus Sumerlaeaceae bacterium]|nr:hypothetical protein [Candidatus Sumerlaeaceae bacterium]